MTTKISTITAALDTLIGATLVGITKIPNPYEPEENPDVFLKYGYGIGFESADNTRRELGECVSIDRQFAVMLFREIAMVDTDASGIQNQALAVLEDEISLIKAFEAETAFGGGFNCRYVSSDPLQYLADDAGRKFFRLLTIFSIEYEEEY